MSADTSTLPVARSAVLAGRILADAVPSPPPSWRS
jgi:hypothetical protein